MKKYGKSLAALAIVCMMTASLLPSNGLVEVSAATTKETTTVTQETKKEESKATKTTEETKTSTAESSGSENETAKEAIQEGIFEDRDNTTVDLSSYNLTEAEATALTDEVLDDSNTSTLVTTSYETDEDGIVTEMSVDMDEDLATAYDQIDEVSENADNSDSDVTLQDVYDYYAEYQAYIEANPDYFGITVPYNSQKDAQGPINSMLTMAGISQEYIDAGYVTYSDLYGMVQLFYQGNAAAVEQFGDQLLAVKDQALAQLDDSMSVPEKLLVLNDWLANWCEFDMSTIMVDSDNNKLMVAEEPVDTGVDENIMGLWEGNQFGALCLQNAVCAGYANAYAYLVQWAFPDVYQNSDGSWKTKDELNYITDADGNQTFSTDAAYMVDWVRISYDASVTMYGEENPSFQSDHYWNAVKVDGKWYYVDPCYNDVYVEVMSRDRVETDGNTTHLYFLFSDDSARNMYDGNFSGIDTLYEGIATDTTYEDAWFAHAKSAVTKSNNKWYYYYDSTDLFSIMNEYGGTSSNSRAATSGLDSLDDSEYKLVYHEAGKDDSDATFTTLVDFNNGQVLNPSSGELEDNDLIKELYAEFEEYQEKYPSISISASFYNNKFYFSLSNCILTYDISSGAVTKLMEYNEVSATRDKSVANGGMAFSVVDNADEADFTVMDHPIAAMVIKNDTMYVSIATNFAFISGKSSSTDKSSYGYEFEETDYNSDYSSYMANLGYSSETNDNDEFMFSANFVDTISMSDVTGSHSYETVTVPATCDHAAFTEERCTTCGVINSDTRATVDGSEATAHHFVKYDEQYYTKTDDNWNTGTSYVCTICLDAKDSTEDGDQVGHIYDVIAKWAEDHSSATMTVECETCEDKVLDCLQGDDTIELAKDKDADVTAEYEDGATCETGGDVTYTASLKVGDTEYKATAKETVAANTAHVYGNPTFKWSDDRTTCQAIFACAKGDYKESVDVESDDITSETNADKSCTEKDKVTYTATYTDTSGKYGDAGKAYTGTATGALAHIYDAVFNWKDYKCDTATLSCEQCPDKETVEDVEVTNNAETQNFSCTVGGTITYTAACKYENKDYSDTKDEVMEPRNHSYVLSDYTWSGNDTCKAVFECEYKDDKQTEDCQITVANTAATCEEDGSNVYTATFTDTDGKYGTAGTVYSSADINKNVKEVLTALGHDYAEPVFAWDGISSCKATFTCKNDAKHTQSEDCTVTSKRSSGSTIYTALCSFLGKDYNETKTSALAKTSYSLYATQSLQIELGTGSEEDAITAMTSSDTKVVAVSNSGTIKGVKAGSAVVTATTQSGATIKVKVAVKTPRVTLTATSAPLQVKKSTTAIKVKSKLATDSVAKWSTSNQKVATVDSKGKITAKKVGSAKITATMKSGAKVSCTVKVQKAAVKLTKLAVNKSKVTLQLKGGTKTFTIVTTKTPVTATDKVTYKSSNSKVAAVSSAGKITAKKAGSATITVKCGKKTNKIKVTVKKK